MSARMVRVTQGSIGQRLIDRYMADPFEFNGETKTRAEVYRWFEENGFPSRAADYWIMGAERTQKQRKGGA